MGQVMNACNTLLPMAITHTRAPADLRLKENALQVPLTSVYIGEQGTCVAMSTVPTARGL